MKPANQLWSWSYRGVIDIEHPPARAGIQRFVADCRAMRIS